MSAVPKLPEGMQPLEGMDADTSQCVCDHLAIACDQLAEAVAFMQIERHPCHESIMLAFGTLYKLRAEIGFTGGRVVADLVEESEAAE